MLATLAFGGLDLDPIQARSSQLESSVDQITVLISEGMHHSVAGGRPPASPSGEANSPTSLPWTSCGVFCAYTAYRCSDTRERVCLSDIRINDREVKLVSGFTGSCITQKIAGSTYATRRGCTSPSDGNGDKLDPDFVFVTEDQRFDCFASNKRSTCLRTMVYLMPNDFRTVRPNLDSVELKLQSPAGADFTGRAGYALTNGEVEAFVPSRESSDVVQLRLKSPYRQFGTFAEGETVSGLPCDWFTLSIDACVMAPRTGEPDKSLRILLYPGPLRQRTNPSGFFEPSPKGVGTYFWTRAQYAGAPTSNSRTGELSLKVASPHLASDGSQNTASLSWYWPANYLKEEFGLRLEDASPKTIDINRSATNGVKSLSAVFAPSSDGLKVDVPGITFSAPSIGTRRIVTVKRGAVVRLSELGAAMGLAKVGKSTALAPVLSPKLRQLVTARGNSLTFLSRRIMDVPFRFRDEFGTMVTKTLRVAVE